MCCVYGKYNQNFKLVVVVVQPKCQVGWLMFAAPGTFYNCGDYFGFLTSTLLRKWSRSCKLCQTSRALFGQIILGLGNILALTYSYLCRKWRKYSLFCVPKFCHNFEISVSLALSGIFFKGKSCLGKIWTFCMSE